MMEQSLRILVVQPMYGGSLPVAQYCAQALQSLGHLVESFEAPEYYSAFMALKSLGVAPDRLEYLENSFLNVVGQSVLAKVESFEPDLVLALAQAPLSRQALKRLRKEGVPTAMWFVEDSRLFTYWRAFAPFYDFFAVIQKTPFLDELAELGVENALYLPMAAQEDFHRPLELSSVERRTFGSDVSFLGAGYANRRVAFRRLTHLNFKIWGSDWDGDTLLGKFLQRGGERIAPDEAVKIFNASKINLNLHSSVRPDELVSKGDFVNPRTFELACCGGFQLVDERALLFEHFAEDELATFSSMDDLMEKIDHFLRHAEERAAYAAKARERTLAEHTYTHRMETLLAFIQERRSDWPKPRAAVEDVFAADYPEALKNELIALLGRLELPADAPFDDVIVAVRRQKGALSGLDTALLFLDEWKKQYVR